MPREANLQLLLPWVMSVHHEKTMENSRVKFPSLIQRETFAAV